MQELIDKMLKISEGVKGSGSMEEARKRFSKMNRENKFNFPKRFKEEELILFSFFAQLGMKDESDPFLKEISEHFGIERSKVIALMPHLENLRRHGYLEKAILGNDTIQSLANYFYFIPTEIMTNISMNILPDPIQNLKADTIKHLIFTSNKIIQEKLMGNINLHDLIFRMELLLEINAENELVKGLKKMFPIKTGSKKYGIQSHEFILLAIIFERISNGEPEIIFDDLIEKFDDFNPAFLEILQHFDCGTHILLEKKFLQEMKRPIRKRVKSYEFTEEGLNFFLGTEMDLIIDNSQSSALIVPEELQAKALFFDGEQSSKLNTLSKLLAEGKFEENKTKVADHFKAKGGISIILHGAPGTGKTEFVNQLAKQSNRPLFKVDLANNKSMWYGESERLTKNIFVRYKQACKKNGNTPILFINEADGLFSRRLQVEHSIDQTSNTIQNIMLEEMEQFEGILVATTNLMMNLDPAFDRRFLMKIKFELPGTEIREQVWKSILPTLPESQASLLAESYKLSPAQIENVARKMMLRELVGESTNEVEMFKLCEEEIGGEVKRMGFC